MNYTLVKDRIALVAMMAILFPFVSFAQTSNQVCSPIGYTIATINGVFTEEPGARKNRDNLKALLDRTYNNEPITIDFLYNPSHASGAGDVLKAIQQGLFSDEDIRDTDLLLMLGDASRQVKTQKLLLVPHSQGNFYANAIRKNLADQSGGVPSRSIGIFGVASPASHIYDGGTWLTSTTDKVIAGLVGKYSPKGILTPNTTINFRDSDGDLNGHDFTKIYLKYKTPEIINGIQSQLSKLQADSSRSEDVPCIEPPNFTVMDKIDGATLAVLDNPQNIIAVPAVLIANLEIKAVVAVANAGIFVAEKGSNVVIWTAKTTAKVAVWYAITAVDLLVTTYNTGANVAFWTYQTGTALTSAAYSAILSIINNTIGTVANGNSATVFLATQAVGPAPVPVANKQAVTSTLTQKITQVSVVREGGLASLSKAVVNVSTDPSHASIGAPRLVFIGNLSPGFGESENNSGGGWSSWTQVSGVNVVAKQAEPAKSEGAALAAPSLSAPQCAFSLATSGCLLATTTLRFEWTSATTTAYYSINKNGILATTTEHSFETNARDFSDYIFEIASVDNMGTTSATSTQKISVATIPIAINEIAWMGTIADTSDEWIELKNNTGHTIDLSQWALEGVILNNDGKKELLIKKLYGVIKPREYIVLERTNDSPIADIATHQIYTGALINSGDQLTLSYASTTLDRTPDGAWVAGDKSTSTRKTMERYSSKELGINASNWATWGSNVDFIKNGKDAEGNIVNGTPGTRNSTTYLINKGQDIVEDFTLKADEDYYLITKPLIVTASSTFTIEAGVIVKFLNDGTSSGGPTLVVLGALHATGNSENPIVFESSSNDKRGKIKFIGDMSSSTITYVRIEKTNGIQIIGGAHLSIADAQFLNNFRGLGLQSSWIMCENDDCVLMNTEGSTAIIRNTHFASTTKEAIEAEDGSFVSLVSSTITNTLDSDAVAIYDSTFTMISSTIDGVSDGGGIYVNNSIVSIASSTIRNVWAGDGIYLRNSTSTIINTVVENTVESRFGDGIDITGGSATITDSLISGFTHGAGISVVNPITPVVITSTNVSGNNVGIKSSNEASVVVMQ